MKKMNFLRRDLNIYKADEDIMKSCRLVIPNVKSCIAKCSFTIRVLVSGLSSCCRCARRSRTFTYSLPRE